jgi:DNA-binding Lrp family transcriptional regulator
MQLSKRHRNEQKRSEAHTLMTICNRNSEVFCWRCGPSRSPAVRVLLRSECHYLTGEFDCLLKVVCANHDALRRFKDRLMKVGGVDRVRTSIVLDEIKSARGLPLNAGRAGA